MKTPAEVLRTLRSAINSHDVDAVAGCFAPHYRNETPAHPARGFVGREQVSTNWSRILSAVPDLRAEIVDSCVDGSTVWAEWDWSGSRSDGSTLRMRGVTVLGVAAGLIARARFYLEPVDETCESVGDGVARAVGAP